MFCPECGSEYREGFTICADCNIELVYELPEEDHEPEFQYVEAVSTVNQGDIAFIKSIFDAEKIDYQLFGENFAIIRPMVEPAVFYVREDQVKSAVDLLKDFEVHIFAASGRTGDTEDN